MPESARTYWLVNPCRIRRKDSTLVVERDDGKKIHIPVTDVRDIVACATVDVNTAVMSLLNQYGIAVHVLSYCGDYAGSALPADEHVSGATVLAQARTATSPDLALGIARAIVDAAGFNVRRVVDRDALARPYEKLRDGVRAAESTEQLMAAEGNFRRTAWTVLDTKLPDWLQLAGRNRRPPANAGNAFISYVNGIVYARVLTAIRLTPLHSGIGFLHATMARHRHTLALDLAELFKPMFAERLLLRLAGRGQLGSEHFDDGVARTMLSDVGRKFVVQTVRDELAVTVSTEALAGRSLGRAAILEADGPGGSVAGAFRPRVVIVVYDTPAGPERRASVDVPSRTSTTSSCRSSRATRPRCRARVEQVIDPGIRLRSGLHVCHPVRTLFGAASGLGARSRVTYSKGDRFSEPPRRDVLPEVRCNRAARRASDHAPDLRVDVQVLIAPTRDRNRAT